MTIHELSRKSIFPLAAVLLLLTASACSTVRAENSLATQASAVEITRVVTRQVTEVVTQEVTSIVEVPVTVTPAPTLTPTATPTPVDSSKPQVFLGSLPAYTDCLQGPATYFSYRTSFPAGQVVEVSGRSEDGAWLNIRAAGDWNSCWVEADQVELQLAVLADLPVVQTIFPRSYAEFGSPFASARRDGDEVTVSWPAVFMSVDELRGYLIDAYICQGAQYLHKYIFIPETPATNTGVISTTITDEAGCAEPSKAHIVSVGLRGFTEWEKIFWPVR